MINQTIAHNNTRIILSHERKKSVCLDIYPSHHLLTYVREGVLKVRQGNDEQCFAKGKMVLFKKFTRATITKTFNKDSSKFSSIVFTFHEDLMEEALASYVPTSDHRKNIAIENILAIESNALLKQFIHSLQLFFDDGVTMDQNLARLKTYEALIGILKANESLVDQLRNFSVKSKADLYHYMNIHFLENKKLADFSRESGRSLSVFKKDFQEVFNSTPAQWLKKKRLEYAHKLLTTASKKPSEIFLACGFEDLAHFSKSFKKHFNVNPSQIAKLHRQVS